MSLFKDTRYPEQRIAEVSSQIKAVADADDTARRLMIVSGIEALTATGLLPAAGTGRQFKRARDMAVWLDLFHERFNDENHNYLVSASRTAHLCSGY